MNYAKVSIDGFLNSHHKCLSHYMFVAISFFASIARQLSRNSWFISVHWFGNKNTVYLGEGNDELEVASHDSLIFAESGTVFD
jgi:hypothetical protein